MIRLRNPLLAVAAGLAVADASIVTLALPDLLVELDTTVEGVAAVLGVYTAVLGLALIPLERAATAWGERTVGAAGLALFTVASLACAAADDLTGLLVARGAQAVGGAAGLVVAFALLGGGLAHGRRLWLAAAVLATAVGPALGGALTEAFEWRAIFIFQAPVAGVAAVAMLLGPRPPHVELPEVPHRFALRPALALGFVSAALSAVLFLLVLLLVAGWSVAPLKAAAAVTVIPVAALAGARIPGEQRVRACAGCALVGGGVLALAWLPDARLVWTIAPQVLAGLGMGLSLTALGGGLLPERTPRDAARLLTIRHLGIAAVLALLAPITAERVDDATERAQLRGVALVLDAELPPQDKLVLAPRLLRLVDAEAPRGELQDAVAAERPRFEGDDLVAYDRIARRADETLVSAVGDAFKVPFLVTGALGLLAALVIAPLSPPRRAAAYAGLAAAALAAIVAPVVYVRAQDAVAPEPVAIRDPCAGRGVPEAGGITGFLQGRALEALDATACNHGSSREELVLALADDKEARRYEERYGVDPRSPTDLLGGLLDSLLGG